MAQVLWKEKKTKEQGVLLSEQFSPDLIVQENYCVYWCIEEGPKNKKNLLKYNLAKCSL